LQYQHNLDGFVFGGGQQFISPGNYLMTWSLYYMNRLHKLKIIIETDVLTSVLCLLALWWWTT
jgi:hypothetical protein